MQPRTKRFLSGRDFGEMQDHTTSGFTMPPPAPPAMNNLADSDKTRHRKNGCLKIPFDQYPN